MRILTLTLAALAIATPAKADTFWFSDPAARNDAPEGSQPDCLVGVLLAEDADGYRVRIVGGEVLLPKAAVVRIDKDELTIAAIEQAERDAAEALAAANRERELRLQIGRKEREIRIAEAAMRKDGGRPATAPRPEAGGPAYDPVVGVAKGAANRPGEPVYRSQIARDRAAQRQAHQQLRRELRRR